MDGFTVSDVSGLRSPVVIMAFTGWSDTGTVTTDVATRLIDAYNAERFLESRQFQMFRGARILLRDDATVVLDDVRNRAIRTLAPR